MLLATALMLFALACACIAPQAAWAAPAESAAVETVADETSGDEQVVEEIIEDEEVPLGVRRTAAIGRNAQPFIIAGVIVVAAVFGWQVYRVNRNIKKMNHRIR
jgi:hypothetical protein